MGLKPPAGASLTTGGVHSLAKSALCRGEDRLQSRAPRESRAGRAWGSRWPRPHVSLHPELVPRTGALLRSHLPWPRARGRSYLLPLSYPQEGPATDPAPHKLQVSPK